jgi:hypothetical protein
MVTSASVHCLLRRAALHTSALAGSRTSERNDLKRKTEKKWHAEYNKSGFFIALDHAPFSWLLICASIDQRLITIHNACKETIGEHFRVRPQGFALDSCCTG